MSIHEVIEFPNGFGVSFPSSLLRNQRMMGAQFEVIWQDPKEGPLPAGSKVLVLRGAGIVTLLEPGRVRWKGAWVLYPSDGAASLAVHFGGERREIERWFIESVGVRDDGLVWQDSHDLRLTLPAGMRYRDNWGNDGRLLTPAECKGHFLSQALCFSLLRFTIDDGSTFQDCISTPCRAIGFPRPYCTKVGDPFPCDYCGTDLSGRPALSGTRRTIGGIHYSTCAGHDIGDAAFLAGALQLRSHGSDEALKERCVERLRSASFNGIEFPFGHADTVSVKESADGAARREARAAARAAKVAKLGEMLATPMAPRFQTEEANWRKR